MNLNRRDFMKASALAAMATGISAWCPSPLRQRIQAGQAIGGSKKLVFIFQRGGNDGLNTVVPRGDPEYNATNRPTLFIPDAAGIDLGNGFAQLHPMMSSMMEIYNSQALTGVDGPGNLALLHRIGYSGMTQSHFDGQQYWENGLPGQPYNEEGIFYRKVARSLTENRFPAAAISGGQMVAFKGSEVAIPTIRNPAAYNFTGALPKVRKLTGSRPTTPLGTDGKGLLGVLGGARDQAAKPYRDLVYGTGLSLADSIQIVQQAVAQGAYTPENGADYDGDLGDKLMQVAMLLKRTPVQILGVNIGGWDTHTNQTIYGAHGNLLEEVALNFTAFYRDMQSQWQDLCVCTMTEFGRTSKENGSRGTDHAYGCVMMVAGGGVKGGVYNCDATKWRAGDMFSQDGRYVRRLTDYRAVFGEIFERHFGDSPALVEQIIPSYAAAKAANPNDFSYLNFLPA
jgi:uncharacterized protein (DUF1501 family)